MYSSKKEEQFCPLSAGPWTEYHAKRNRKWNIQLAAGTAALVAGIWTAKDSGCFYQHKPPKSVYTDGGAWYTRLMHKNWALERQTILPELRTYWDEVEQSACDLMRDSQKLNKDSSLEAVLETDSVKLTDEKRAQYARTFTAAELDEFDRAFERCAKRHDLAGYLREQSRLLAEQHRREMAATYGPDAVNPYLDDWIKG